MATRKMYDLTVVVGSYTDNTGKQKNRYQNVGIALQGDNGLFLLLDRSFNPAGVPYDASKGNQIMVSMFEPRDGNAPQGSGPGQQPGKKSAAANADDDIPF